MSDKVAYMVVVIAAVGILSWFIRAVPFLIFGGRRKIPKCIVWFGNVLSPAAIAFLTVYCFNGYVRERPPAENCWMAAEVIAALVTVLLQLKWRMPFVSIAAGTAVYMMLIRFI